MKKYILLILALAGAVQILSAVPAMPGKFTRTLPDGRKVTLELHGDEFRHWLTDESGRVVKQNARGFIEPSSMAEVTEMMGGAVQVNRMRKERLVKTRQMMHRAATAKASGGVLYFPMILVQFPDMKYRIADSDELVRQAFENLANQAGYSANGGTGSLNDYFSDNAMGQIEFHFDVFGPVTVSQSYAYYGTKKTAPSGTFYEPVAEAIMEAADILAAEQGDDVFNPYDNDGDGRIDAVFVYYAGYNEAEGAPEETIWPHEWVVGAWDSEYRNKVYGNVRFNSYSCASELRGSSGVRMAGIGTAVHEFGHALGLPDLYDRTYNNNGDGQCGGVYVFSPMCSGSGSYNNQGRTPAYLTMEERIMLGWADGYTPLPASGTITIPSVDTNFAYREDTENEGEYFVFECRKGAGWDAYTPEGLVVYHVDRSRNEVRVYSDSGYEISTAADMWTKHTGNINAWREHPCYSTVAACAQQNTNYTGDYMNLPFPGGQGVTEYRWQGWASDNRQGDRFYDISFDRQTGTVTMKRDGVNTTVKGKVVDADGNPVSGATARIFAGYLPEGSTIDRSPNGENGPAKIIGRVGDPVREAEVDAQGAYLLDVDGAGLSGEVSVEISAPGYLTKIAHVTLRERAVVREDFQLMRVGDPTYSKLAKFNETSNIGLVGYNKADPHIQMAAIRLSAEDLAGYVGCKIVGMEFVYYLRSGSTLSGVKAIVDFGSQRKLVKDLTNYKNYTWNYVDLSAEDLRIPEGEDCCFGYALMDCTEPYGYCYYHLDSVPGGLLLYEPSEIPNQAYWWDFSDRYGPLLVAVHLENGAVLTFNYISNPNAGTYAVGSTLDLGLVQVSGDQAPESIDWYYDDEPVSGKLTFTKPGRHTLEARYTTADGRRKILEMEITVE